MKLADILVTPLRLIEVAGGDVLHAMKQTDAGYSGFGEAYFSWVSADVVKAWKRHTQMTMNVVVPVGTCLLYTSDAADDSLRVDLDGRRIIKKSRARHWP